MVLVAWDPSAAQTLLHERVLGLTTKFLESEGAELTGKRASLQEHLDALAAAPHARLGAATSP